MQSPKPPGKLHDEILYGSNDLCCGFDWIDDGQENRSLPCTDVAFVVVRG